MNLIRQSNHGNLLHNEKTGLFEIWHNGSRVWELMETEEESAIGTFSYLCGENWEPTGEQGSK